MEKEIEDLNIPRHSYKKPNSKAYSRDGFNPAVSGSGLKSCCRFIQIGEHLDHHFENLQSHGELKKIDEPTDQFVIECFMD